jgi:PAS domain S-box-containing protein
MQKILAIDDKQDNLTVIRALVKNLLPDAVVFLAQSGQEGVAVARRESPDVILLDLIMPEMDGFEVCSKLKADETTHHIPIIILTAIKTDSKSRIKALNKGADAFLTKPIDEAELVAQINAMLRIKRAEDKLRLEKQDLEQLVQERTKALWQELMERKRAEEAFRESEEKYRQLFATVPDAITMFDHETRQYVDVNASALRLYGYTREEFLTLKQADITAEPDESEKTIRETLAGTRDFIPLRYHKKKDGMIFPAEITATAIALQGRIVLCGVIRDITERTQAEKALRESEHRLHELFDHMSSGVAVYEARDDGEDFIIKDFNQAGERISNVKRDEVVGRRVLKIFPDVKAFGLFDVFQRVWRTGRSEHHPTSLYNDNRLTFWAENYVYKLPSGEIVAVFDNVTERKQAEAKVQESEALLKTQFENSPDLIMVLDREYRYLSINKILFGPYTVEELIGQDAIQPLPPHIRELVKSKIDQCFTTGMLQEFEHEVGAGGWVRARVVLLPSADVISQVMIISTDITERKRAEEELKKHRNHLEELVQERTRELTRTNEQLEQEIIERKHVEQELHKAREAAETANRAKSEFLANMSHELRTPLNAILGFAQILRDDANLTERQRKGLDTIKNSGDHLLSLINEILDFAKLEAGRIELRLSALHLPTFLASIVTLIRVRAEQKGIALVYEPDSNLPVGVRADEKHLWEVLINLLENAVKYTEKGKVSLRVFEFNELREFNEVLTQQTPKLQNSKTPKLTNSQTHKLRFEVEDTGIGIAPEYLDEILLPFRQVSEKRNGIEGVGLGLAISDKLVNMMGSKLHVQSTVGKGSLFWFDLELPEAVGFVSPERSYGRKVIGYQGERRIVFVVDDDENNRAVLMGMLLPLGFRVLEAQDGQECLEKARKYHPDLILLDLRMPGLDGFGTTKEIRNEELRMRNEALSETPDTRRQTPTVIIAVSASVFEETRQRALTIGFNDFLIKPFQLEDLLNLVQMHLQLEWIYADVPETANRDRQFDVERTQVIPLPPAEVENLHHFAKLGIAKQVFFILDTIEQHDAKYAPFVKILRQLAGQYQFERIIELLEVKEK